MSTCGVVGARHREVSLARWTWPKETLARTGDRAEPCGVVLGWSRELLVPEWSPLCSARFWAGLSQGELAAIVGTSRETISSLERGTSIPSVTLALAIARALETTVEQLFAADVLR
jgi:putative transcriptional regulator